MPADFKTSGWCHNTNIYEVNLRQYTAEGTFNAFAEELPRLHDMGIEVLWFMPITPIGMKGRKGSLGSYYACADYEATNPEFGTVADFKNLVDYAHQLGFKVIIDWVANHTGLDHRWTREHPDFYAQDGSGNFTERNGWDDVIDLNFNNPALRTAMIAAMHFWIDQCGIDGFRCDMAHLVVLDFWKEARMALEKVKPLFWLAECEDIAYHEVFDATYTWRWMHTTEQFAKKQTGIDGLWQLLQEYDTQFPADALRAYFTSNHDENSWNGTEYEKFGTDALSLAVFSCTWNGVPLIYSGQELPNQKRLKFFDRDPIEWTGSDTLHEFYKKLLKLRTVNPALRAGDEAVKTYRIITDAGDRVFSFRREHASGEVIVLINFSTESVQVSLPDDMQVGSYTNIFTAESISIAPHTVLELAASGFLVLQQ